MTCDQTLEELTFQEALQLVQLSKKAAAAKNLEDLANLALPEIAQKQRARSAFLYLADCRLAAPLLLPYGDALDILGPLESLRADCQSQMPNVNSLQRVCVQQPAGRSDSCVLDLHKLSQGEICPGMLGLVREPGIGPAMSPWLSEALSLIASAADRIAEIEKQRRQLSHLNTYVTVSAMLAQSLGLRELIQSALYCCKEIAACEEASILLLDDDKKNLLFYELEGSSKELIVGASFPADKGIAGSVVQSLRSEIVDDVQNDPRFYGNIDAESRFKTRNMIAIPLVAGEEKIGVMSVLNRIDKSGFTREEHLSLKLIAEEVAFAIRNARIFEYVVDSYCKQRQGQRSCKGCKRPLGSWTPCVRYRSSE